MELDVTSPEQVCDFVNAYGTLAAPWPNTIPVEWTVASSSHDKWLEELVNDQFPSIKRVLEAEEALRFEESDEAAFLPASFMLRAGLLRDAIRVWQCVKEARTFGSVCESWESGWAYHPSDLDDAVRGYLVPLINRALSPFAVVLYFPIEGVPAHENVEYSTYNLLALQLANAIAQQAEFHVCQRPECGQVFVHQDGRAKYGQHKSRGVKYCTSQCASSVSSKRNRDKRSRPKVVGV